jgi:plasmid stabilization system protein ParE
MREVIISTRAQKNIESLFDYLETNWSKKVKKEFALKLYKTIQLVRINPESFPKSTINSKYSKCVINKQATIYYSFNNKQLIILALFDTRQNPKKTNKIS